MAESAMSGIGKVADEVRVVRMEAVAAAAEAKSVKELLQTQTAPFSMQAEASAERATEMMEGRVQALASHTKAQMSRVTGEVIQRLKKEIEATAMSTAATAEARMRDTIEGMWHDFQAKLERNLVESCR